MASFQANIPEDFFKDIENIDKFAEKMITAAAPVVVNEMKSRLQKHDRTGQLSRAVKASKPKYNSKHGGHSCVVRPTGQSKTMIVNGETYTRKKPVRNMEKLAALEFGKSGQAATPVVADVVKATENEVSDIMQKVYEQEAGL